MARGRQEQDTVYAFVSAQVCWDGKDPPLPAGPNGHHWLHYTDLSGTASITNHRHASQS